MIESVMNESEWADAKRRIEENRRLLADLGRVTHASGETMKPVRLEDTWLTRQTTR
ncbi:hypothetical protein [Bifidobacterium sp. SO1]|uniref:hypothetical protein n=1 Tax=Bifidobacterium sp. SO1 TaxID=2809029 RepID=UPI001BDDA73E|nr:hypothetical protein [Bifidobacterium sp. SO1]MBT1162799.1 hypothetical protein [Bifidobacterium sp. SO1]